jgi:hypothetical protein
MTHSNQYQARPGDEPDLNRYASFIVRCWPSGDGHIQARLIDARSGRSYPVADLADLPERIRSLVAEETCSES